MATFGAPASGTGSREPSPAVSALTGFDPSRGRSRSLAKLIARFEEMDIAFHEMLYHGLHGGPAYDLARDRFNALVAATRDEARAAEQINGEPK
jgi:hypothetical protein